MRLMQQHGTWYYVVDIGRHPVTGKRQQKKKGGFARKKDAEAAARKLLDEIGAGVSLNKKPMSFLELSDTWLAAYQHRNKVKPNTIRVREKERNVWLRHVEQIDVASITRKMVQDALNQMREQYADNTLSGIFATFKMMMRFARELNLIRVDPSEFAYIPKIRKTVEELEQSTVDERYMERDTLKLVLETAKQYGLDHDHCMFYLLSSTGLRIGEALALKWRDIDIAGLFLSVTKTMYNPTNNQLKFELLTPKTTTSVRTVSIGPLLAEELKKLRTKQKEFRLKHRDAFDQDFVFITYHKNKGYPLTAKNAHTRLNRTLKIAQITQRITLHTFRHTHTSLLAAAGVGLTEIMERLGHKNDDVTKEVYLHVTKELKKEAAHKFDQLMHDL